MTRLSDLIKVRQRYLRSINLERDLDDIDSVRGYIPTSRSTEALTRFFQAYATPNTVRAWTVTSVYGTGKSAFANFLTALCADTASPARQAAEQVLESTGIKEQAVWSAFENAFPDKGLLRAVTAAQREPIANTVIRALHNGAQQYWRRGRKPDVTEALEALYQASLSHEIPENADVLRLLQEIGRKTPGGVLLIIDELGKNLEYIAEHQSEADMYLLQQIAELPTEVNAPKVMMLGLLHQSFAGYASKLGTLQKNEWTKIQGRFEDISFAETTEQVVNLIAQAIEIQGHQSLRTALEDWESNWISRLKDQPGMIRFSPGQLQRVYPLHPVTVQVLPVLCYKYAQNDRSLFTFLTGSEPYSLSSFLNIHRLPEPLSQNQLSTLRLHDVFDYFIESVAITSQPKHSRWLEIQSRILDASGRSSDEIKALKTIGILNLVGNPKAGREAVVLSLCSNPDNINEREHWQSVVESLIQASFVTWRQRIDEIRIWEGSDFDIDTAVKAEVEKLSNRSIANIVNEVYPRPPIVAQRHSYQTGTLRFYECQYVDHETDLTNLRCSDHTSDGKILYWVGTRSNVSNIPNSTTDHKPTLLMTSEKTDVFNQSLVEYLALKKVAGEATQLATDGVARKEMKQRTISSKSQLDQLFQNTFDITSNSVSCVLNQETRRFRSKSLFSYGLSEVLNAHYPKGLCYQNELLNRRRLTPNAMKARRELMTAMLENESVPNLGLKGYGPDVNMYQSLLAVTGIHREIDGKWQFSRPAVNSGVSAVWDEIERYFSTAIKTIRPLDQLLNILQSAPYGVKEGPIPVLITAVLLKHADDIGLYYKDRYLPHIEPEHLEFLARFPERYAVKHFNATGVQADLLGVYEGLFKPHHVVSNHRFRNQSLLSAISPLIRFVSSLPKYTKQTRTLPETTLAVREAIIKMTDPEQLLFVDLPETCGFLNPDEPLSHENGVSDFMSSLTQALSALQNAYPELLKKCQSLLCNAFSISATDATNIALIRELLSTRAQNLADKVIEADLKRFVTAAVDKKPDERQWLESLVMVIADRPVKSWTDQDISKYELNLATVSRKLKNLEAIQSEPISLNVEGYDAFRISLTKADGREINDMIWMDSDTKQKADDLAEAFLTELSENDDRVQMALVAALIQRIHKKS